MYICSIYMNTYEKQCMLKPFLLVIVPLILAVLEIWHPVGFRSDVFHKLHSKADWWYVLHLLQLPLFGLVGAGGILLTWGKRGVLARLSVTGFWIFMVFYTAFDAINGISIGAILLDSANYTPNEQATIAQVVQNLYNHPYVGGSHSILSEVASIGWVIGMIPMIYLLAREGMPYITIILYFISTISLWWSHAYPYGPIAFSSFALGSIFLLLWERNRNIQSA